MKSLKSIFLQKVEMLASTREKRANAGNKMGKMLDEEDEEQDDFYKNTYGGFEEVTISNNVLIHFKFDLFRFG